MEPLPPDGDAPPFCGDEDFVPRPLDDAGLDALVEADGAVFRTLLVIFGRVVPTTGIVVVTFGGGVLSGTVVVTFGTVVVTFGTVVLTGRVVVTFGTVVLTEDLVVVRSAAAIVRAGVADCPAPAVLATKPRRRRVVRATAGFTADALAGRFRISNMGHRLPALGRKGKLPLYTRSRAEPEKVATAAAGGLTQT